MKTGSKVFEARAHGRVNLIGEHTDYNGGWVLPTAIPQSTRVRLSPRSDKRVLAKSRRETAQFEIGQEKMMNSWIDYLQGATDQLIKKGHRVSGFDVEIESSVPMGSGLSSSAALEVSFLKAARDAFDLNLDDLEIARIGQRIENDFVGARVGIMDQMACSLAKEGEALFLDTVDLNYERIRLPLETAELLVINSGVAHRLAAGDGGYNQRRAECEEACRQLGVAQLRDLSMHEISRLEELPELLRKRARHVVTENERVHEAVKALRENDLEKLGRLFYASHDSMRNDYEVSIPEIDFLVKACALRAGVWGARLTGGGFGGSIVALVARGQAGEVARGVVREYFKQFGLKASVLVPQGEGDQ